MKRKTNICTLVMCVLLTFALTISAFAADSSVTYKGRKTGFEFNSESVYTETDLFDNFKQVMPGDTRTEKITIKNAYIGCDYIKVWIRALLHDEENNPISPNVLAELTADERRGTMSELEYMRGFLNQLTLTVWNGEKTEKNVVFRGAPESLDSSFDNENVYLGSLGYNRSMELNVELSVNLEMGNEYAERIGEVDWVLVIEERNSPSDDPEPTKPSKPQDPTEPSNPADPGRRDEISDEDMDIAVRGELDADGYWLNVLPMTGDNTVVWPFIVVGLLALIGLIVLIRGRRKEEE